MVAGVAYSSLQTSPVTSGTSGGQERDKRGNKKRTRGKLHVQLSEGRPSYAGGPRFDPQCPLFHQTHVIY